MERSKSTRVLLLAFWATGLLSFVGWTATEAAASSLPLCTTMVTPVDAAIYTGSATDFSSGYSTLYRDRYTSTVTNYFEGIGSHPGVDITHDMNGDHLRNTTQVVAICPGEVWRVRRNDQANGGWGNSLVLRHEVPGLGSVYAVYAHLADPFPDWKPNQRVDLGTPLGTVDSTGKSSGDHLHFQVDRDFCGQHPFFPDRSTALTPEQEVNTLDTDRLVAGHTYNPMQLVQPRVGTMSTEVYSNDFEGDTGVEWSTSKTATTPVASRRFFGEFGNETVTLTLDSQTIGRELPSHFAVAVSFELFVIRSWDGNDATFGPDVFDVRVEDGVTQTLLHTTFSNSDGRRGIFALRQAYPDEYPGDNHRARTVACENNTLGYTFDYSGVVLATDAVYRLSFEFPHFADSLVLKFSASGLQELFDESWGLDNVKVGVVSAPFCPAPAAANMVVAAAVAQGEQDCGDQLDNDCDQLTDCLDPDCGSDPSCAPPAVCGNGTAESGEECDGTDDAGCPGLCQADCKCGSAILSFTEFPIPTAHSNPTRITAGPDGNLWFAEYLAGKIGKITTSGSITDLHT